MLTMPVSSSVTSSDSSSLSSSIGSSVKMPKNDENMTDHKGFFEKNNIGLVISVQSQQYYCEIITDDEIRCWVLETLIEKIK